MGSIVVTLDFLTAAYVGVNQQPEVLHYVPGELQDRT